MVKNSDFANTNGEITITANTNTDANGKDVKFILTSTSTPIEKTGRVTNEVATTTFTNLPIGLYTYTVEIDGVNGTEKSGKAEVITNPSTIPSTDTIEETIENEDGSLIINNIKMNYSSSTATIDQGTGTFEAYAIDGTHIGTATAIEDPIGSQTYVFDIGETIKIPTEYVEQGFVIKFEASFNNGTPATIEIKSFASSINQLSIGKIIGIVIGSLLVAAALLLAPIL
jgi:hypothetical protein